MSEGKHLVVYVTAPPQQAPQLAEALVERRLAACVNILEGVRSFYQWKGEVCDDPESLLVIKTRGDGFEALRAAVVELHPHDVPEVIALPIIAGHPEYLRWIEAEVKAEP